MKTLFVLLASLSFTTSAMADFPTELLRYQPLKPLAGEFEKGFKDRLPYSFKPGAATACKATGHPLMGGIVIFNCAKVGPSELIIGNENLGVRLRHLQVTHQYYRPVRPGDFKKKGWIRNYSYSGTYEEKIGDKTVTLPLVLGAWFFVDAPDQIAVGYVRLNGQGYPLTGRQQ